MAELDWVGAWKDPPDPGRRKISCGAGGFDRYAFRRAKAIEGRVEVFFLLRLLKSPDTFYSSRDPSLT